MGKKIKGKITGERVHEVGYRVMLLRKALELGIERFNAFNTREGPQQVILLYVEADEETLVEFQKYAESNFPENALISNIVFEGYQGYVMGIADYMHLIQVEQLSKGIPAILSIDRKQDKMLEKQDKMLEKQDTMLDLQKETIVTIKIEGQKTRESISTHISQDIAELRQEILQVKSTLAKVVDKVGVSDI